ncbi:helix-turn-helix domain-containing protein [Trueperella bialowiezensis]|uniref:helix-turn-helix domain-containing protein n=1 Tax=Trueperella bialowiezensis TaxID=312285 RepID=UPI0024114B20|nr:helix-turn-helix transcriptional regulator [Trueperella bialowiezensis]
MDKRTLQARRLQVAGAIRSWRSVRRMTQAELACALGVPQSWVSNVESGARRLDIVEAEELAKALGISVIQLLEERGRE